tara:strand:- start:284 stop:1429 length:1146 start_codon:yes stop_codon:yes gene_type:complete
MYAGFKIYKEEIVDDEDRRSWRENPVGVSAVIIPPPCKKKIDGKGVVDDIIVTNVGTGYTTPPGDGYPVGLQISGFIIIDPGINYGPFDRIQLIFPNYPSITIDPFYVGTPTPGPTPTPTPGPTPDPTPTPTPGPTPGPTPIPSLPPETPETREPTPYDPPEGDGPPPEIPEPPDLPPTTTFDGGGGPPGGDPPTSPLFTGDGSGGITPGDPPTLPPFTSPGGGAPSEPGLVVQITLGGFGRFENITVSPEGRPFIPPVVPKVRILSQTGINASIRPIITVVRDPLGVPPENLIQVTDLVGLKQTGYIDGRPYYGQVFTIRGIKYAGVYGTVGELIQVYDTLQESITRQVTTPPPGIIRQGTDITQNDPRLNIPETPDTIE